jgi:hypothetical protein
VRAVPSRCFAPGAAARAVVASSAGRIATTSASPASVSSVASSSHARVVACALDAPATLPPSASIRSRAIVPLISTSTRPRESVCISGVIARAGSFDSGSTELPLRGRALGFLDEQRFDLSGCLGRQLDTLVGRGCG